MESEFNQTIGQIVAYNYKTATLFNRYGIDFCCNGNRTMEDVCNEKNLDLNQVLQNIEQILRTDTTAATIDYNSWPLDLLADYIEKTHHRYVEVKIQEIEPYLEKICKVHGNKHPELFEIRQLFHEATMHLTVHMKKEEFILFPYARKIVSAKFENSDRAKPHFGTVENPIQVMMQEHTTEGDRFRKIEALSNNYTPPNDACNTYKVTYALLKEFQDDLHLHIHLENNILFPKMIAISKMNVNNAV